MREQAEKQVLLFNECNRERELDIIEVVSLLEDLCTDPIDLCPKLSQVCDELFVHRVGCPSLSIWVDGFTLKNRCWIDDCRVLAKEGDLLEQIVSKLVYYPG